MKRRRWAMLIAIIFGTLSLVLAVNTARQQSKQIRVPPGQTTPVDALSVSNKLAALVRLKTVASRDDADANGSEFLLLHEQLERAYPRTHSVLHKEVVGKYSLLYTWRGTEPNEKPVAFLAHMDVVPIAPGTESTWTHPPFSGEIRDGYVWGRGAWDNKSNLVAQLEAVELLIKAGYRPRRTIYFAFGHDEEVAGLRGAQRIVEVLRERGVHLDFVMDEGLIITSDVMAGMKNALALIGVAEKGYLSVSLEAKGTPGHSSAPPETGESAIGVLSAALHHLDERRLPSEIRSITEEMFATVAPELDIPRRVVLSNLWLFKPLATRMLESSQTSAPLVKTTTALTVVRAGNAENVIPGEASATVNFRLLPGDSIAKVMEHVNRTTGDRVLAKQLPGASEPSRVSPTNSSGYKLLNRTLRSLHPDLVVAPGLLIAATDSRHFEPIAANIFRFSPIRAKKDDLARFHGTNERVSTANLVELVQFYWLLLHNLNEPAMNGASDV